MQTLVSRPSTHRTLSAEEEAPNPCVHGRTRPVEAGRPLSSAALQTPWPGAVWVVTGGICEPTKLLPL